MSINCSTSSTATPLPDAKPELHRLAAALTPGRRPGDYAQALMDLGATIFVEHEQARPPHQPLRHRQHLLLPAAQRARLVTPLGGDLREEIERLVDAGGTLAARQVVAGERQIVGDRELGEDTVPLDDMGEPGLRDVARAPAGEVVAGEDDRSGFPAQEPGDGAQQGRLAGPVRPEQRDDLAGADAEINAVQHVDLAIAGFQPAHCEQRFSRQDRH